MSSEVIVLVVEDELIIRMMIQQALESGGYVSVTAGDGEEALALLEQRNVEFRGFVTDIRLGRGPNGWELARRARELEPEIAVVYVTGDSADRWPAEGVPKSLVLEKPFAEAQLITAISTMLNGSA
ncbi:response regulator [Novosphingobium sp. G106]|uniref:response regulator n=1 Tax=Novosphingobium sp. G106 TaxID=2849500 RepID=UPI001C2DB046|nr:response regulator [Novosphingobium sp. G106]MBV1691469.1 response regulator [Novosphingobium sp. G106]